MTLPAAALDTLIITHIATAQSLTETARELTQIDLILAEGYDTAALTSTLPAGNLLVASATRNDQVNAIISAFRVNLTALSAWRTP